MKRLQLFILALLMACGVRAEIGYAMIVGGGDTVTVNNDDKYPMMSVFKLHQAIALCDLFDRTGQSLDSIVEIPRSELNPQTWSPMLSDIPDSIISLPIRGLLNYALTLSDNNASNYLFNHIQSVKDADEYISTLIPRESFHMEFTEDEMFADHSLARGNHSSPLGAAMLIKKLFTDSIVSHDHAEFLRTTLASCQTGTDRIPAAFTDITGVRIAHKTGSGFRDENGLLTAQNDVAFIELPDGRQVTIAIFVKDFDGDDQQASELIKNVALRLRRLAGI